MILAQLQFSFVSRGDFDRDQLENSVIWYLACLLKNGQISESYEIGWSKRTCIAAIALPRKNSLAKHFHSSYGLAEFEELKNHFGKPPHLEILTDDRRPVLSTWKKSRSLFLFTYAWDCTSPLCCGNTGATIPTYMLPIPDDDRERLFFWSRAYRRHDHIFLDSAALEMPAYKQLADPTSQLSSQGRGLCKLIEQSTNLPTYYFLMRYWGRSVGEEDRVCPSCGQDWRSGVLPERKSKFHEFAFRCEPCRFVSHLADSYDDERHARIGEYRRPGGRIA